MSARATDDVVAELHTARAEPFDVGGDVVDDELQPVPAAGEGTSPSGMGRPAELFGPDNNSWSRSRTTAAKAGEASKSTVKFRWVV
ncbi:hypothetical protein [Aldersonia kunmingensis]|uniref:hypothetical protein n=1 Tax=Aldersonia kunmingensis TaxID=408066 RepID=UPI00082A622D